MRIICAGSGLPELSNKKIVRESGIFFILLCTFFYPGSFYFAIYLEKFVRTLGSAIIYSWSQGLA